MRKTFTLLLVMVMSVTLLLAGCSQTKNAENNQNQPLAATPDNKAADEKANSETPEEMVTLKWGT